MIITKKFFLCLCFPYYLKIRINKNNPCEKDEQELDLAFVTKINKKASSETLSESEQLTWADIQSDCTELDLDYFSHISKVNYNINNKNNEKNIRKRKYFYQEIIEYS